MQQDSHELEIGADGDARLDSGGFHVMEAAQRLVTLRATVTPQHAAWAFWDNRLTSLYALFDRLCGPEQLGTTAGLSEHLFGVIASAESRLVVVSAGSVLGNDLRAVLPGRYEHAKQKGKVFVLPVSDADFCWRLESSGVRLSIEKPMVMRAFFPSSLCIENRDEAEEMMRDLQKQETGMDDGKSPGP